MTTPFSSFHETYQRNFGPFINKFNLGGTVSTDD